MPETYTLTKDNYLYSFIDITTSDADRDNPPLKLAITTTNKTIAMFSSGYSTIINSGDKLIVHDTEISQSDKQTLAKLFYFTEKTLIYKSGWVNGLGYFFFGVNCDGCSILCVPQSRETPTVVTKFELPLMFDWSKYNVKVPDSPLTKKQSQVDTLNEENLKLKKELQEKEQRSKELEDKRSKLNQELEVRNEKLQEKESKIKELKEQISAMIQEEEEKNNNMEKLNQELLIFKLQMEKNDEEMKEKERKNDELKEKQSKLEQELDGKNKELVEKESKIKSLGEQQLIMMQQQEEKNREMKKEIVSLNEKLSTLRTQIMIEEEAKINELRGKLQEKENQLEIKKEDEEEMEKLKEKQAILVKEMEEKDTKIIELQQQLHLKDEKVTKSDFQLVANKFDQLLTTLQTGHLPQTQLQPLPIPEFVKSRSRNLVPDKFSISSEDLPQFTKRPQFRISMKNIRVFTLIDENVDGKIPKDEICIYTSDRRFHKNEWWFIKVAEHRNITMVAFYDGDMDEVSVHGNYVRVPFRPETSFRSGTQFFVGLIRGIGLRFMFLYELI